MYIMKFKLLSAVILTALSATAYCATEQTFSDGLKIKLNEKSIGPDKYIYSDLRIYDGKIILAIANPDKNNISHNYFDEFNVGKEGMYIGNQKNAGTIITEVIGNSSSLLKGNIEVIRNPANLIIANPNGITCNGCNFSNATDVTLANASIDSFSLSHGLNLVKNNKGGIKIINADIKSVTEESGLKKLSLIADNISIRRSIINVPEINIDLMRNEGNNITWNSLIGSSYEEPLKDSNRVKSKLSINKNSTLTADKIKINLNESSFINRGTLGGNYLFVTNTIWKDNLYTRTATEPEMKMVNKGTINSKSFIIKTTPETAFAMDPMVYKSTFINNGSIASHIVADLNNSTFINNKSIEKNPDVGGDIKLKLHNGKFINNGSVNTSEIEIEHRGNSQFTNNKTIDFSLIYGYSGKDPVTGAFDRTEFNIENNGEMFKYNSAKKEYQKFEFIN